MVKRTPQVLLFNRFSGAVNLTIVNWDYIIIALDIITISVVIGYLEIECLKSMRDICTTTATVLLFIAMIISDITLCLFTVLVCGAKESLIWGPRKTRQMAICRGYPADECPPKSEPLTGAQ